MSKIEILFCIAIGCFIGYHNLKDKNKIAVKNFLCSFFIYPEEYLKIMRVHYDLNNNEIECINWFGRKIHPFCGDFNSQLLEKISTHCVLNKNPQTVIYIWSGMITKNLAYNEPINNYLNDIDLWKTGQGFGYLSGKKFDPTKVKPIQKPEPEHYKYL